MGTPIIRGTRSPVRKSVQIRFDPQQGTTTTQEYESAGDNCGGLAASLARQGYSYDLTSNPVRSRLVATQSWNPFGEDSALERWELLSNQQQQNLREHPNSVAIGQAGLAQVLKDARRHEDGKTVDTSAYTPSQLSLFNLLIRGVTHYPLAQWVLRYTANVSNSDFSMTSANSGIGTIYTMAQAINSVPSGRIQNTLASIPTPAADSNLIWGWLKQSATETTAARNRVEVSAEYWLAQWPVFIYG